MFWLIGIAAAFAVLLLGGFMAYVVICYMPIIVNLFEEAQIQPPLPTGSRLEGEEVRFPSADGTALGGMFLKAHSGRGMRNAESSQPRTPTIVFCHEYGSDMHSLEKYGKFLTERGFNVFTFDYRGHGVSKETNGYVPRQWVTDKEVQDTLGAIAYLKARPDVDSSRLGIFGISRGAGSCICVASQCDCIKAVVADSAFSTELTLEKYMKKWVSIYAGVGLVYRNLPNWFYALLGCICRKVAQRRLNCKFPSVERSARQIAPTPLYMIYGEKDNYVGLSQAKELFGLARQPKDLWVVPGARHNESVTIANDEYARNVAGFFERSLSALPQEETG